jgi:hypothetical protein
LFLPPWITIEDLYLLLESGEPKSARVYPEGGIWVLERKLES